MSLRHALLGLLAERPGSGYDLIKTFQVSLSNVWPATQSQVYTELTQLEKAGLVEVVSEGARGRKEYAPTDEGREVLRHWLLETKNEPEDRQRNDVLLRVFLLGTVTPQEAESFMKRRAEVATRMHEDYEKLGELEWGAQPLEIYGRIILEWALRFTEMQREWSEWAAEQIRASAEGSEQPEGGDDLPERSDGPRK
ncbi:PadR family transcriptional regulator [Streptomyces sp. NPDC093510]|uniref:PadR family transcriptional regulator n=1 Tax=Streptomyces sp. NPDC093510 TaxID=3155199 RepID=UPI003431AFCD